MRSIPKPKVRALLLLCAGLLSITSGKAGTATYTFDTDPTLDPEFIITSNVSDPTTGLGFWEGANGDPGGYIAITRAVGSEQSQILFPDFDKGLVVKAFTFECDLRLGNPTSGDAPADGFSINYARAGDPAVQNLIDNPTSTDISQYWLSGAPEDGTSTGLAIAFDTWAGNTLPDGSRDWPNEPTNGGPTGGGIILVVDGKVISRFSMPVHNGTCTDVTSLQTGPRDNSDPNDPGSYKGLCWAHLKVVVDDAGTVTVSWKGQVIIDHAPTGYAPSAGRLLVAGRTGGSNENNQLDNVTITTVPSDKIVLGGSQGQPTGFVTSVSDSGASIFSGDASGIVSMSLNGKAVTATQITKGTNGVSTIRFSDPANPIPPGSTNTVVMSVKDSNGVVVSGTNDFVGINYTTLDPATAASNVDKTKPGFILRIAQVDFTDAAGNTHASDVNTGVAIASAERILHGDLGPNTADLTSYTGPNKTYSESKVINYNAATGNIGDYPDDGTVDGGVPSPNLPGLPSLTATRESGNDDAAMEIVTYIEFPKPGSYRLIFNSDDGFRTTTAANPLERLKAKVVSVADVGRGAADSVDWVFVPTAGIYPFRTVWCQGGGGANLEWSAISEDGVKALINDSTTTGSLKAYQVNNGPMPAAVSFVDPPIGTGRPPGPGAPVVFEITDGATAVSNIKLNVNGAAVTPTVTKSGSVSKVVYTPNPILPVNNTVVLSFNDGANVYTGTNTFTATAGIVVPPSVALKATDVDKTKAGFLIHTYQVGITNNGATSQNQPGNSTEIGEIYVNQWFGWPNVADLAAFTGPGGSFVEPAFINFNGGTPDSTTAPTVLNGGNIGTFPDDGTAGGTAPDMPGIVFNAGLGEGGVDNYALEIRTVLDLQPGLYEMGVNSDDGFRMIVGDGKEAFTFPLVAGEYNGGRGADNWGFTRFTVQITQAGLYPFRMVYEEGGGGNNVEWFVVNKPWYPDQLNKTLINDTANSGIKAYQYPLNATAPTYVKSFSPARSSTDSAASVGRAGTDATVSAILVDGTTPVTASSISMKINGAAVTPTINQSGGQTTVSYKPAAGFAMGSTNTVDLSFTDRTVSWSFIVGMPSTPTFWIESADFNYNGGQTKPEASVMPYSGGAYAGLGAVAGTDYNGPYDSDNPYYRYPNTLRVPVSIASDFDRGSGEVTSDFRLGWMGGNHWYNYTRTFPAGTYNVYAALSSGGSGDHIYGNLADVTGGTTNILGVFSSSMVTTGGGTWGNNNLVPLKDVASTNTVATVTLSGTRTLRYNDGSGDFDFILFAPVGSNPSQIQISSVTLTGGNITITWTGGGTAQTSTDLKTWADIPGANSGSYTTAATGAHSFYRIRQ
jgi:hypothetical protein